MPDLLIPQLESGSPLQYRQIMNSQLEAAIQVELGTTGYIFPLVNTQWDFAATTFGTRQSHADGDETTVTWNVVPSAMNSAPQGFQGIVPTVLFNDDDSDEFAKTGAYLALSDYPVSFGVWVKMTQIATNGTFVGMYDESAATVMQVLGIDSSGQPIMVSRNSNTRTATSSEALVAGAWAFIVGTVASATDRKIYVNAVERGTNTDSSTFNTNIDIAGVGKRVDSSQSDPLDGTLAGGGLGPWIAAKVVTTAEQTNMLRLGRGALGKI